MVTAEPVDAILAIDVGNTRLAAGIWDADGLHDACRVPVDQPDQWPNALNQTWNALRGDRRAVVIASVNPPHANRIQDLVEELTGLTALRVRDDLPLPIPVDVDNEFEVGVDRVCCAAAAFDRLKTACAVASFGTAITIDCVSADGRFLGGAILPGIEMCCHALHTSTAQLPRVKPRLPHDAFGKNTHDAIVNGVVFGALGALREIVERYATDLREWPQLVITGGNAPLVAQLADFVDAVVPDLSLIGIALAHQHATGQM